MNHLLSEIKRRPLILGTIILTLAGLLSRLIGFFLRIYTAHLFTEEEIGIFQLIAPLLALSFVLTGAGLQTAVRIRVDETWGDPSARIFEVRVY